jgi:CheY-like chemotaxis protein
MIESILLVDDENLFHLVFEDACSLLDITLQLQTLYSVEEAEKICQKWVKDEIKKPDCVFVDLNILGSGYDGIELIRRVNSIYGNGVVIGVVSSSSDLKEIERAIEVGAQFWIIKTDKIEQRLVSFKKDFESYKNKTCGFKIYQ